MRSSNHSLAFFLFLYFWLLCVFLASCSLSPVVAAGDYSPAGRLLFAVASLVVKHGLQGS